jgi:hypothetical protein
MHAFHEFEQFKRRQFRNKVKNMENSFKLQKELPPGIQPKEIQAVKDTRSKSNQPQSASATV